MNIYLYMCMYIKIDIHGDMTCIPLQGGSLALVEPRLPHTSVPQKPVFYSQLFSGPSRVSGGQHNFGHPESYPLEFSNLQNHSIP